MASKSANANYAKYSSLELSFNNTGSSLHKIFHLPNHWEKTVKFRYCFTWGMILYHLGYYKKAAADFSKALRVDWRDEGVVLWIDRAERAHRATLLRQTSHHASGLGEMPHPLSVWDRPTCHRFAYAGL
jgi:tetratricopeptide (TPR) repeat protein